MAIESARARGRGLEVPVASKEDYAAALRWIPAVVAAWAGIPWDPWQCRLLLAALGAGEQLRTDSKGQAMLGGAILELDPEIATEFLHRQHEDEWLPVFAGQPPSRPNRQ